MLCSEETFKTVLEIVAQAIGIYQGLVFNMNVKRVKLSLEPLPFQMDIEMQMGTHHHSRSQWPDIIFLIQVRFGIQNTMYQDQVLQKNQKMVI